jgi:hypothetical protein
MSDDMHEILVDLKSGLDRIEGKIDSNTAWMVNHAKEHAAASGRQRGAATVWGKIAAFFAGVAVLFWPPRH